MIKNHLFGLMILLCTLSSCSVTTKVGMANDYYSMYGGKPYSVIVNIWGAPDRVESDGAEGKILIYENYTHSTKGSSLSNTPNYAEIRSNTSDIRHFVEFYMSPDDSCYKVRTNHVKDGEKKFSWLKTGIGIGLGVPIAYIIYSMLRPKNS